MSIKAGSNARSLGAPGLRPHGLSAVPHFCCKLAINPVSSIKKPACLSQTRQPGAEDPPRAELGLLLPQHGPSPHSLSVKIVLQAFSPGPGWRNIPATSVIIMEAVPWVTQSYSLGQLRSLWEERQLPPSAHMQAPCLVTGSGPSQGLPSQAGGLRAGTAGAHSSGRPSGLCADGRLLPRSWGPTTWTWGTAEDTGWWVGSPQGLGYQEAPEVGLQGIS